MFVIQGCLWCISIFPNNKTIINLSVCGQEQVHLLTLSKLKITRIISVTIVMNHSLMDIVTGKHSNNSRLVKFFL